SRRAGRPERAAPARTPREKARRPILSRRAGRESTKTPGWASQTEFVAERDDLAAGNVDRGDVRREVAVANDDLMPAFGQPELGERRRRARRRAGDLALAPRADRYLDRARRRCDERRRRKLRFTVLGFALTSLAGAAILCRFLGDRGAAVRRYARTREFDMARRRGRRGRCRIVRGRGERR